MATIITLYILALCFLALTAVLLYLLCNLSKLAAGCDILVAAGAVLSFLAFTMLSYNAAEKLDARENPTARPATASSNS